MPIDQTISTILFVCMGNICRSPTAEAVMRQKIKQANMPLTLDSAGTIGYHQGAAPDPRAMAAGMRRGLSFEGMAARKVVMDDFERFDLILAADKQNLADLKAICPVQFQNKLQLVLAFTEEGIEEVPDPYYGGEQGFEYVLDLLESSCEQLLLQIQSAR